jgi:hypothetical protein
MRRWRKPWERGDDIVELIDPLCIDRLDVTHECVAEWSAERQLLKHPASVVRSGSRDLRRIEILTQAA